MAVAPMAQPDAEPVEDYEYVLPRFALMYPYTRLPIANLGLNSYEGLPPNFSLLQNMAAGAFAGIAVGYP